MKKPTEIKKNEERGRKKERVRNTKQNSLLTNNKSNDGEGGDRKGWRGQREECVGNREKGVVRSVKFVERKGRKKVRRKQDEIMEEEEVDAEDNNEGEDKDKGRGVRESKEEEVEEEVKEGENEGDESTTAEALRLMTPWSYQVGRSAN